MNYEIGDTIVYIAFGGVRRTVLVDEKDDDIKNGCPGFGGIEIDTGVDVWGYDDQIVEVVR